MNEILKDIWTWPWFSEPHNYNFNGHLILHPDGNLCIDPVEPPEAVLEKIVQQGVSWILLTNRNHSRAANQVRSRTGARTAIHPSDADHARSQGTQLDESIQDVDKIGPLTVVELPGKSPGEVGLYWEERKLLLVGDAIIGNPLGRCGLLPEKVMDSPEQLRRSVRTVLDLDFDTLLVGDGESILQGAKRQVHELIATF